MLDRALSPRGLLVCSGSLCLENGVLSNFGSARLHGCKLAQNRTLPEVRPAYLASFGANAAMIRRTTASRADGMISIIVIAEGP